MPPRRDLPDDRPNIGTTPFLEELQALEGEEMPADQDAVVDPDEIEGRRTPTLTELDQGDPELRSSLAEGLDGFDGLAEEGLRDGETDDPEVAAQEGMPWVPPIDPPVVATPWSGDPVVAAGTGVSALDEAFDEDNPGVLLSEEGDINERIREALRADSSTSRLADILVIGVVGSTAIIRGMVDDIDDTDAIVAVVERVPGIEEVRDETEFPGL
ncbi:MAG: hypothetical protein QOE66_2084 [Chloroflexota bacterium]|jgi:hypothetical protein|nr:hypothetical protein [Chloroflexota bacterium]